MCQLDMCDLQLGAVAADHGMVLAPIELEGLAGPESQGNKDAAPCRVLFALAFGRPLAGKRGHPVVGTGEPESDEIGMQVRQRPALLA